MPDICRTCFEPTSEDWLGDKRTLSCFDEQTRCITIDVVDPLAETKPEEAWVSGDQIQNLGFCGEPT
jgi:hypothetical protein